MKKFLIALPKAKITVDIQKDESDDCIGIFNFLMVIREKMNISVIEALESLNIKTEKITVGNRVELSSSFYAFDMNKTQINTLKSMGYYVTEISKTDES